MIQYAYLFILNNLKNVFIFGCTGTSLLFGLFSSYGDWGLFSICNVWAFHCHGFFFCGAQALECGLQQLQHMGSLFVAPGLQSTSSMGQLFRGKRDLPRSGTEPMPPALAGGFFTTEPPGKPLPPIQNEVQLIYHINFRCTALRFSIFTDRSPLKVIEDK